MAMNVVKGWPLGGALDHNVAPTVGAGIVAGMFVKRDSSTGKLVKATGAAKEVAMFALDSQSDYDVIAADRIACIVSGAMVETDQFVADTYTPGEEMEVSTAGGESGKVRTKTAATAPTVAWVDSLSTVDGVPMLRLILAGPIGTAT